jgi:hypothetical protein
VRCSRTSLLAGLASLAVHATFSLKPLAAATESTHMVIVGDSLLFRPPSDGSKSVADILQEETVASLPHVRLGTLGFGGAVLTGDGDRSALHIISDKKPLLRGAKVLLLLGSNDVLVSAFSSSDDDAIYSHLERSVQTSMKNISTVLASLDVSNVGLAAIPNIEDVIAFEDDIRVRERVRTFRLIFSKNVNKTANTLGWPVIDLRLDESCLHDTDKDGMHPNAIGTRCLAAAYIAAIKKFVCMRPIQ